MIFPTKSGHGVNGVSGCTSVHNQPEIRTPERNDGGRGCTTRSHKTHISDRREVCYRWHPWTGRPVLVVSTFTRAGRTMLRCRLNDDDPTPPLELPDWMFDRVACGRMNLTTAPFVTLEHLLALRALLRGQSPAARHPNRVQERYRPINPTGDADANPTPPEARQARSVHPTSAATDLDGTPARDPGQDARPVGSAAPGGSRSSARHRNRQGGGS